MSTFSKLKKNDINSNIISPTSIKKEINGLSNISKKEGTYTNNLFDFDFNCNIKNAKIEKENPLP